jgi:hypothetical protein
MLGETLEIETPYSTIAGDVISVFITLRNNHYIITDGACIDSMSKAQGVNIFEKKSCHLHDMLSRFSISEYKNTTAGNLVYRLKKTDDVRQVSSYVYDMIHFIDSMSNVIMLETFFSNERDLVAEKFRKKVNDVLRYKVNLVPKADRQIELFKNRSARALQFSSTLIDRRRDSLWLGMCINGSNYSNYIRSVQRADFGFNHAQDTELGLHQNMQFAIITDSMRFNHNENLDAIQNVVSKWNSRHRVLSYTLEQIEETELHKLWCPAA